MPLPPTNPAGAPTTEYFSVDTRAAAATADVVNPGVIAPFTGYLTAARVVMQATLTGADTNSRTLTVVDPTTRQVTDGIVVDNTKSKGPWVSGTAYALGDTVIDQNVTYSCISAVTGATNPGQDPTHWTPLKAVGLQYLTSLTANFTADDVGKTIAGTGYTSATITAVQDARTVQTSSPNSAVRTALTVTIGASRVLATKAFTNGINAPVGVEVDMTLDTGDTKVYQGDQIQVNSTHVGASGLADPGGLVQLELTSYAEGT